MSPRKESTLVADGIRRSVAFFPSGRDSLYGSIYRSESLTLPPLVLAPSWGNHLLATVQFAHELGVGLARTGGAALVYHPPGQGDSLGDPRGLSLARLAEAAADAAGYLAREAGRTPCLAGIRLGALVVGPARRLAGRGSVLLIQPLLDPAVALGSLRTVGAEQGSSAEDAAASVAALESSGAVVGAVHYATPQPGGLPAGIARTGVPGDWRHSGTRAADLAPPILEWLRSVPEAGG